MAAPPRPPLLIVNDEPAVREALEVALAESNLLHTATPGAEACTLLKTHPIGALVLEVVRKVPGEERYRTPFGRGVRGFSGKRSGCFEGGAGSRTNDMKPYPLVDGLLRPVVRVAMPRAPRLVAPAGTVHVVARCNNREFYFTTADDFEVLLAHLREVGRTKDRAIGSPAFVARYVPRRGRPRIGTLPSRNQEVRA